MPGAGAVHHIRTCQATASIVPDTLACSSAPKLRRLCHLSRKTLQFARHMGRFGNRARKFARQAITGVGPRYTPRCSGSYLSRARLAPSKINLWFSTSMVLAAVMNNTFFGDGQAKGGLGEMPSAAVGTQSRACIPVNRGSAGNPLVTRGQGGRLRRGPVRPIWPFFRRLRRGRSGERRTNSEAERRQ
jgi:hypothetical protein